MQRGAEDGRLGVPKGTAEEGALRRGRRGERQESRRETEGSGLLWQMSKQVKRPQGD